MLDTFGYVTRTVQQKFLLSLLEVEQIKFVDFKVNNTADGKNTESNFDSKKKQMSMSGMSY